MATSLPLPRCSHAAVGIGSKLYVWGGYSSGSTIGATGLEIFDVPSMTWEQPQILHGSDMPDGLRGMALTTDGETSYTFGGATGSHPYTYYNILYQVTPSQHLCEEWQPASPSSTVPEKASGSRMVEFQRKLILQGGHTGQRRISELHVFDLETRVWALQPTTGEKPPPLDDHTFIKIDNHRAVVFGGYTGTSRVNDTYVLDMETWHWTKLVSEDKPPARSYQGAFCIEGPLTGQQHPLVMVVGGCDDGMKAFGDVWLLDVDRSVWSKVTAPETITPRWGHSAVVFGSGPSFRVVVLFGGVNSSYDKISETTLLLLELKAESWQVIRVVKPYELGTPDEKLREQMRKLVLSPQEEFQAKSTVPDTAVPSTAHRSTLLPPHTGEGRVESKNGDDATATIAHAESTSTVVTIDFSDLEIGNRRLGKGGYGCVYEGKWKEGGEMMVAIKITRSNDPSVIPQEIKVWMSLPHHRNITKLIGVASANFNTYIVTELAVNGSLFDYLHIDKNTPSLDQSLTWASDVAHGMKHLHDHDIIHRDLKSANVLLTSGWVAKLCDFGSARELTHTTTTEQAGTYRWMSPEITRKAIARINKKCDLFSYGMILFELFAHEIPYADLDDKIDVLLSVTSGKRPPIPPSLPSFLHDLLKGCWEEDPHLRPSFDDFVNKIVLNKSQ